MSETVTAGMARWVPASAGTTEGAGTAEGAGTTSQVSRREFLKQSGGLTFCFAFAGFFGNGNTYAAGTASGTEQLSAELNAYVTHFS